MELNRASLRREDWQEVADAVNARHGDTEKTSCTHVLCKNRMDTLKRRYRIEKTKITRGEGTLTSSWPFFSHLELLIGTNIIKHQHDKLMPSPTPTPLTSTSPLSRSSPPMGIPLHYWEPPSTMLTTGNYAMAATAAAEDVVDGEKDKGKSEVEEAEESEDTGGEKVEGSYYWRNYILPAAAAAAGAEDVVDGQEDKGKSEEEEAEESEDTGVAKVEADEGLRRLANAMVRFGEIYEKVEIMKQMQMVDLEKQRMLFAKDLDFQRMQSLMDTWVQIEKIKQAKKSRSSKGV